LQAEVLLQAEQARGNDVLSNGQIMDTATNESGIIHLSTVMTRVSERRREPWRWSSSPAGKYLLGVPRKSALAPPAHAWPRLENQLYRMLEGLADRSRYFYFKPSPAWLIAQFFARPGVRREALVERISTLLCPPGGW